MSQWQSRVLAGSARSCYHTYIASFATTGRVDKRNAERAERFLVRSVLEVADHTPTKAELLEAFLALIIEVEGDWPEGTTFPTRPHGL